MDPKQMRVSGDRKAALLRDPRISEMYYSIADGGGSGEIYLWVLDNPKKICKSCPRYHRKDDAAAVLEALATARTGGLWLRQVEILELAGLDRRDHRNQCWIGRWLPAQERRGVVTSKRTDKRVQVWFLAEGVDNGQAG